MATAEQRTRDLALAVATEMKKTRTLLNGNQPDLSALTTSDKTTLVAALNSLQTAVNALAGGAKINDSVAGSLTETYSATHIRQVVNDAIATLEGGASQALDTLGELAAAIGNDSNFAATMTNALTNRVRHDTPTQGLTAIQKSNARQNIDAYGSQELGNPDVDLAAVFTAGLN